MTQKNRRARIGRWYALFMREESLPPNAPLCVYTFTQCYSLNRTLISSCPEPSCNRTPDQWWKSFKATPMRLNLNSLHTVFNMYTACCLFMIRFDDISLNCTLLAVFKENSIFCFLKSRILTCHLFFFRNKTFLFVKIERF